MDLRLPRTIGKYDLLRQIGKGSMASVYLAEDPIAGRQVAVKVANPEVSRNDKAGRRRRKLFFNEAKAAGMLRHPNIVSIYDFGVDEDLKYIVMEYVPGGETLQSYCHPERLLPVENVVRILLKCAVALDYAHRRGVIHRDIKPRNILLDEDQEVKLGDFGIALISDAEVADTQVHGYIGSPLYMAPEQLRGEAVTCQCDLFALGVTAYELLTGHHPFYAETLPVLTHRITQEPHQPVQELRADVPDVLARVVDRLLKKHPAGRYQMGLDLAGDLSLIFDEITLSEQELSGNDKLERVRDLAFFESFPENEIWEVLNASVFRDFEDGTEIVREGEEGSAFYVLVSGESVVRKGNETVDVIARGESFGEVGLLLGARRTASVVARGRVTCLMVRAPLIERTSIGCRLSFQKAFTRTLACRLTRTMQQLSQQQRGSPMPRLRAGRRWELGED